MANIWLSATDLSQHAGEQALVAAFDDSGTGSADPVLVNAVISRAENEVLSWLVDEFGPPPIAAGTMAQLAADPFLKGAALEYAICWMYDRRPEYFRSSKEDIAARVSRADLRMERVLNARQRAPTVSTPPANVGGVSVDNANRIYVDSGDGTQNSGDY